MSRMKNSGDGAGVRDEAIRWMVRLSSGTASSADHKELASWRQTSDAHELEWQRLVAINGDFAAIPSTRRGAAGQVLAKPGGQRTRRQLLIMTGAAGLGGGLAWNYRDEVGLTAALADVSTPTGGTEVLSFSDGTRAVLNTATAIDVSAGPESRRLSLHSGEIALQIDDGAALHEIETQDALFAAAAGSFIVRILESGVRLAVQKGEVTVAGGRLASEQTRVTAGQTVLVRDGAMEADPQAQFMDPAAWLEGKIIVNEMPLAPFLDELSRYRRGWITASAGVRGLGVSGVYRTGDIAGALTAVAATLPIRVSNYSPYFTRVSSRT